MATEVGKIAASTKKNRKAGRWMNWNKYGKRQPVIGLAKRTYDVVGKFLGLTERTPVQQKLALLAYALFGCALLLAVVVSGMNRFRLAHRGCRICKLFGDCNHPGISCRVRRVPCA